MPKEELEPQPGRHKIIERRKPGDRRQESPSVWQGKVAEDRRKLPDRRNPVGRSKESLPNWEVIVLEEVKNIKPSLSHPGTHFTIERLDGTSGEIESKEIIFKIKNKDGTEIEVPASAVQHIMSFHQEGGEAGSKMEGKSLEHFFRVVAEYMPSRLPFVGESAAFEINLRQKTGTEGVASQEEMKQRGIATDEDLQSLNDDTQSQEAFRLNREGTDEEKAKFVEYFNSHILHGKIKLGIRGGSITPFFTAEKQPTRKMFIVVGEETDADGSYHKRIWTMAPGRYMEELPTDDKFTGKSETRGIPKGTTIADLWKKLSLGKPLSDTEITLVDEQRKAQECWWKSGFVVPPEEK